MFPDLCTPPVDACAPQPRFVLPVMSMRDRFDSYVGGKLYRAQHGARTGLLGGIGIGGVLGAMAGLTAASNPIAGVALAATGALQFGAVLGGAGAIVGGLLGLSSRRYAFC